MTSRLDSFETALLAELRATVSARRTEPSPAPHRARRRRWLLAAVGVTAATVTALAVLPGTGPQPAYAVTIDGNGEVHVRIHRLEDASGLKSALKAQGITADVRYIAPNMMCAPGRYAEAPTHSGKFHFTVGGDGYTIDLGPGVIHAGETLVIAASRVSPTGASDADGISNLGGTWAQVGVATGKVAPCVPVPVPAAVRNP